jgi:hypothetical protein
MKKILISAGALAALALSTPAFAAATNQATAQAFINIVSPITVTKNADLNFGTIVGPFSGEVVHVDSTGARTCPATLTCSGATVAAASFTVSGTAGQNIVLTLPTTPITMNGSVSGTLSLDVTGDEPATSQTLDASGNYTFGIGGKVTIPTGTADGLYTGDIDVTANYQ